MAQRSEIRRLVAMGLKFQDVADRVRRSRTVGAAPDERLHRSPADPGVRVGETPHVRRSGGDLARRPRWGVVPGHRPAPGPSRLHDQPRLTAGQQREHPRAIPAVPAQARRLQAHHSGATRRHRPRSQQPTPQDPRTAHASPGALRHRCDNPFRLSPIHNLIGAGGRRACVGPLLVPSAFSPLEAKVQSHTSRASRPKPRAAPAHPPLPPTAGARPLGPPMEDHPVHTETVPKLSEARGEERLLQRHPVANASASLGFTGGDPPERCGPRGRHATLR